MAKAATPEEVNNAWLGIVDSINEGNYKKQLHALCAPFDVGVKWSHNCDPSPDSDSKDISGNTVLHKLCTLLVSIDGSIHEAEEFREETKSRLYWPSVTACQCWQ